MAVLWILLTSTEQKGCLGWGGSERQYCGFPYCRFMCVQGKADNFLADKQLLPENLMEACTSTKTPIILRMQEVGVQFSKGGRGGGAELEVKTGV